MSVFKTLRAPIGLAPMAGMTTAEMAAKVSNAGILGSLGCGMMSGSEIRSSVEILRARAPSAPIHLNLFVIDENPEFEDAGSTVSWISDYCNDHGYDDLSPRLAERLKPPFCHSFASQFAAALDSRPTVLSFTFGLVPREYVERCKAKGIEVWGTATTVAESKEWWKLGVDAVILQGSDAGGHRGSFTTESTPSASPLLELVKEAAEVGLGDFIVAGGIMNGSDVEKYMKLGASGALIGTLFMGATDSSIPSILRVALKGFLGHETAITRGFSGRWARSIKNEFLSFASEKPVLPYPVQSRLTQLIRVAALKCQDPESTFLWAGVRFPECRELSIHEIVNALVAEYREELL